LKKPVDAVRPKCLACRNVHGNDVSGMEIPLTALPLGCRPFLEPLSAGS